MIPQKKEIVYTNYRKIAVIVADGEYKGVEYVCVNRGIHPCAYVFCTQEFLDKHATEYETIDEIHVHGGISYIGNANELLGLEDYDHPCFGWEYGHAGDWVGYLEDEENIKFGHRKYTTDMLISDCKDAIDQYLKILENDSLPPDNNITKEFLRKNGFKSAFCDMDDSAWQISGEVAGKKWKIYIDLRTASLSYAINQSPRRKYEGEITTKDDLKSIIQLFDIPIKIV